MSLNKVLNEFNLQQTAIFRIYINGSKPNTNGQTAFTHFWKPFFTVFDQNTGQACHGLSKNYIKNLHIIFDQLLLRIIC